MERIPAEKLCIGMVKEYNRLSITDKEKPDMIQRKPTFYEKYIKRSIDFCGACAALVVTAIPMGSEVCLRCGVREEYVLQAGFQTVLPNDQEGI